MLVLPKSERQIERWRREIVARCGICGGKGYTAPPPAGAELWDEHPIPCLCERTVLRRVALLDANVPPEFWEQPDVTFTRDQGRAITRYVAALPGAVNTGASAVFVGENGTGKTMTAVMALSNAYDQRIADSIGYLTVRDYVSTAYVRDEALAEWRLRLARAELLVLDELGKEHHAKGSEHHLSELDDLLRWRRGQLLPTIVVTNYDLQQVRAAYGDSIWSILQDRYGFFSFSGGDWRVKRGTSGS